MKPPVLVVGLLLLVNLGAPYNLQPKSTNASNPKRFNWQNQNQTYNNIGFTIKSIKCEANPKYITSIVCRIKPTRDGHGLTTVVVDFNNVNDMWVHLTMYYKYTMVYRQYMIDFDVNICCIYAGNCDTGIMFGFILNAMKTIVPDLVHECPFNGPLVAKNIDGDRLMSLIFPQVIPSGDYKINMRWHTKNNETLHMITFTGILRARDIMQTMLMG